MKVVALGASKHKGNYEGVDYDYSKIYLTAPREQTDISRGSSGVDMRAIPEVFEQARRIDFSQPVICELETELRALGGGNSRETVVSIKPLKA